ncbi:competence protein CoiA [Facklamia miroungae]|uniref:Competence protein CoiA-like family, contains a predicted nuclease domain n=1 Tax=Facklamia miroungae TaxID=120956 RepID=A0A1G7TKA3_9LACT|nr:competence protein CoiA family protein [Facklamia miroungae]NKZ29801.1 hypothetical protein [Facklamia miroungae]SDG35757.1 Competence protein CoiA-like family, contains a predicted nuclease domain [Facklamia miroungae]
MYLALNLFGEFIYADQAKRDQKYFCLKCSQKVILIERSRGRPYFRHIQKCAADNYYIENKLEGLIDEKHKGESIEHKKAKDLIIENGQRFGYFCQQEVRFENINQIADLLVKDNTGDWIIEFQKSVIPARALRIRQQAYQDLGYQVQWLIDDWHFKHKFMSHWIRRCLSFSAALGYHLWTLDINKQEVNCYYQLPLIYCTESLEINFATLSKDMNWIKIFKEEFAGNLKKTSFMRKKSIFQKKNSQKYSRICQSIKLNPSYHSYLRELYNYKLNLNTLPTWMFDMHWGMLAFKEPAWLIWVWAYESYVWMNRDRDFSNRTEDDFLFRHFFSRMNAHLKEAHFHVVDFPLLSDTKKLIEETFYILFYVLKDLHESIL